MVFIIVGIMSARIMSMRIIPRSYDAKRMAMPTIENGIWWLCRKNRTFSTLCGLSRKH